MFPWIWKMKSVCYYPQTDFTNLTCWVDINDNSQSKQVWAWQFNCLGASDIWTLKFSALERCSSHNKLSKLQSPGNLFKLLSYISSYFQSGKLLLIHKRIFSAERNWNLADQTIKTGPLISQLEYLTRIISIWITSMKFHSLLIYVNIYVYLMCYFRFIFSWLSIQLYLVEYFSLIMFQAYFIIHYSNIAIFLFWKDYK